jgi:AbrB family looped-hinge helix DNA binding protein
MSLASLRQRIENYVEAATVKLDEARARSRVVDVGFKVVSRERIISNSVLSAFIAFRLFVFVIPYLYVIVAGLGAYGATQEGGTQEVARRAGLGAAIARDIAEATQTSDRGRWLALTIGGAAMLWASLGVSKSLYAVHLVAWRLPRVRMRTGVVAVVGPVIVVSTLLVANAAAAVLRDRNVGLALIVSVAVLVAYAGVWLLASLALPRAPDSPWTALLPGAALVALGLQAVHLVVVYYFVDRVGRASEVYGALGVALVALAWLFLIGRLTVAGAEVNASLWEQRWGRVRDVDTRARVDPDGRVAVPQDMRSTLGLEAGDQFEIERDGEAIRLAPVKSPGSSPSAPRTPPR